MKNILLVTRSITTTQKEIFDQKLHEIEQRHLNWFKNRPAIFDQQQHDSLNYHTFSEQFGGTFSFIFWKNSELPEIIKSECVIAFEEVFGIRALAQQA